jgi:hypothetical protein
MISPSGLLEISNDKGSIISKRSMSHKYDSIRIFHSKPIEELVDGLIPIENILQLFAVSEQLLVVTPLKKR